MESTESHSWRWDDRIGRSPFQQRRALLHPQRYLLANRLCGDHWTMTCTLRSVFEGANEVEAYFGSSDFVWGERNHATLGPAR